MKALFTTATILSSLMALTACQSMLNNRDNHTTVEQSQPALVSQVKTVGNNSTVLGDIYFRQVDGGVQVFGKLTGLPPNATKAIHIHENGLCANMGKAAGGHFNPANKPHGAPNSAQSHAGDMPNITANANGVAVINYLNKDISINMTSPNSVYHRSIIIHDGADDYVSQPSGDAGSRIACGVIDKYGS